MAINLCQLNLLFNTLLSSSRDCSILSLTEFFVSLVNALGPDTVDEALRNGREVMELEKWDRSIVTDPKSEITSTSTEEEVTYYVIILNLF